MSDAIDEMQKKFLERGMTHMLIKPWNTVEFMQRCAAIDAAYQDSETRLQIAEGRREDKRAKKRERRAASRPEMCLIVLDQRRGDDRRGHRRL